MRQPPLLSIGLSVLLATSAIAVPSSGHPQLQNSLSSQLRSDRLPLWRSISDPIIRKVWGIAHHESVSVAPCHVQKQKDQPSQLARHGEELVLRFNITTAAESAALSEAADTLFLDVWEFTDDWVDIRLAKSILPSLLGLLPASLQHAHLPLFQERELAQAIANTFPSPKPNHHEHTLERPRYHSFGPELGSQQSEGNLFFADYQPLSVIQPWMRLLASLFTSHVRVINIGLSYEGRDINALKVGVHPTNDEAPTPRKTILVTGGVHAREWISTSTVNYIAYSLITGYGKDPSVTRLLEQFDWIFVPTFNPDGYIYSWETDRLWRKNRQQTNLRFCRGLDLDRSFAFEWDGTTAHTNPCSESFAGEAPFDGVESKRLADWARNETENNNVSFVGFLDLHSYSQQILYPYSYSCDAAPPSLENLQELAAGLAKSIRQTGGHYYQAAPACEGNVAAAAKGDGRVFPRFESGGGSALDWFYHEMQVKYTYQFKLRDRGTYGFLLPSEHIVPTGKEMLEAFMHFGRYLGEQYEGTVEAKDEGEEVSAITAIRDDIEAVGSIASPNGETEEEITKAEEEVMWELRRTRRR